jgi:hypothetical protein
MKRALSYLLVSFLSIALGYACGRESKDPEVRELKNKVSSLEEFKSETEQKQAKRSPAEIAYDCSIEALRRMRDKANHQTYESHLELCVEADGAREPDVFPF